MSHAISMSFELLPADDLVKRLRAHHLRPEVETLAELLPLAQCDATALGHINARAHTLIEKLRVGHSQQTTLDAFLGEYDLSNQEGVVLMCLAEALLRTPDSDTVDRLIHDKLAMADWGSHLGKSDSFLVNASTWGLMLTGGLVKLDGAISGEWPSWWRRMLARSGEPVIRLALKQAMSIMAHQFVMGDTIEAALQRSHEGANSHYRYSFDMLGEAAITAQDAQRYFQAYGRSIEAIGQQDAPHNDLYAGPGISIKLSALHPRFELSQSVTVMSQLVPRVVELVELARDNHVGVTIDAEESERLELTLAVFQAVLKQRSLHAWDGVGLAVQAYQKRALTVIEWLARLAKEQRRCLPIRLVKGAYWDSEIKRAQERGLSGYPVFTRKAATDLSYLVCARRILAEGKRFYGQFATHNAYTVATLLEFADEGHTFEFQRLHGMGESLYQALRKDLHCDRPVRVYAPVGGYRELLPYLVRRLLENGANTSFINLLADKKTPVSALVEDPVAKVRALAGAPHPRIVLPRDIYAPRINSLAPNLAAVDELASLIKSIEQNRKHVWRGLPWVAGEWREGLAEKRFNPANRNQVIGEVVKADVALVDLAMKSASAAFADWTHTPVQLRAACLEKAADLLEKEFSSWVALCVAEAGKTLVDAVAEMREAVDYCRYYAQQARTQLGQALELPGPTGERNRLYWRGRGVFVCISPWNFPIAIFLGQVVAALVAGNCVVAKPASATPLLATRLTQLLLDAGIPEAVLQLLPGDSATLSEALLGHPRLAGVVFTGSVAAAHHINQRLAQRKGPIVPLIAETGGVNAMIVDSTALPEQVVVDVMQSAYNSAGQRCSALRVLFVQQELLARIESLLQGALECWVVGDPSDPATDMGPVIDADAVRRLALHCEQMKHAQREIKVPSFAQPYPQGSFFTPRIFALTAMTALREEVFGPILHMIPFQTNKLANVVESINASGFGLTLGVHSRIDATADFIRRHARVGNVYVNRNMIGAVVGVQPFGGMGLSGTGPKAGGPHYLQRFMQEQTYSVNSSAVGGNASLLSLE